MATAGRAYTPTEAAALSEVAVKSVHNAIDKRIIATRFGREGRELSDEDLLRLKLWYGVGSILCRAPQTPVRNDRPESRCGYGASRRLSDC